MYTVTAVHEVVSKTDSWLQT